MSSPPHYAAPSDYYQLYMRPQETKKEKKYCWNPSIDNVQGREEKRGLGGREEGEGGGDINAARTEKKEEKSALRAGDGDV